MEAKSPQSGHRENPDSWKSSILPNFVIMPFLKKDLDRHFTQSLDPREDSQQIISKHAS
jgi:hypothetical protein